MKRRFTIREKQDSELIMRTLSKKAQQVYSGMDPFDVYEVDTDEGKAYYYKDVDGVKETTLEDLEAMLEAFADDLDD